MAHDLGENDLLCFIRDRVDAREKLRHVAAVAAADRPLQQEPGGGVGEVAVALPHGSTRSREHPSVRCASVSRA